MKPDTDSSHLAAPSSSRTSGEAAPNAPSAHTPGPWFYGIAYCPEQGPKPLSYRGPGYHDNPAILSSNHTVVGCDEYDIFGGETDAEREANIRLMCAAPELLKTLCSAVALLRHVGCWDDKVVSDARAAIAKALGTPTA